MHCKIVRKESREDETCMTSRTMNGLKGKADRSCVAGISLYHSELNICNGIKSEEY